MPAWLEMASGPLLVLMSAFIAAFIGRAVANGHGAALERRLWQGVMLGLLAARAGYVWEFRAAYALHPWSALDLRDGGWSTDVGLVVIWLFALTYARREPVLKWPIALAAVSGTFVWVAAAIALYSLGPDASGQGLPQLTLKSLDGQPIELQALRGKPVVLNLWATWCPPCAREMPVLAEAQAARPDVQFVFANQGEPAARVASWIAMRGLVLRNLAVDERQQAGAALGQRAFPSTYFFDARGALVGHRVGELSSATLEDQLRNATHSSSR